MNIKELKELIKDLPDDMNVYLDTGEDELEGNMWDYVVSPPKSKPEIKNVGRNNRVNYAVAQRACAETKDAVKCLIL